MSLGIYVHFPFCKKKCNYCDFNSSDKYGDLEDIYINSLVSEIKNCKISKTADTVFFGGGTPTFVKRENLFKVISAVKDKFGSEFSEFTVECNPATMDFDGFLMLKNSGVNRLSIGLQSVNSDELSFLGRIHTYNMFEKTYLDARKAGFSNINVDLMFSLHNQTIKKWENSLLKVIELNPEHISCYSLIVEKNTPFYNMKLNLPSEDDDRRMYYTAMDLLEKNGYDQYEISNFARDGFCCRHNLKYWERENYLGFGCGASGLYDNVRYTNSYDICDYIKNNVRKKEVLSKEDAEKEHIFLGLRLTRGFDISKINEIYGIDFLKKYHNIIEKYKRLNLLCADERCFLTKDGLSVSNAIMCEFM